MLNEELSGRIYSLFNAEVDEDGNVPREFPHSRIVKHHKLDISYMTSFAPEGTTVTINLGVTKEGFYSALAIEDDG